MPFLDITTAQASFQNHICAFRPQTLFPGTFTLENERIFSSSWKTSRKARNPNPGPIEIRWGSIMIVKAVATLEFTQSARSSDEHSNYKKMIAAYSGRSSVVDNQSSSEDSKELEEREKLRRMRISKANKGNTPWNKGRRHSPETLQRIRERTRLAMQDPKVKKKMTNLGHAQSEETRMKIGAGVRMGWERRRGWQMRQETCHFQWQNLVAEASRKGSLGEEELQWDSYKMLDEQFEQEWLANVEEKNMVRARGNKRAPKTPEQRRKIAEAFAEKWADPAYLDRVYLGLAKYHGSPIGVERKPRRTPSRDGNPKRSPTKKKTNDTSNTATAETKNHTLPSKLKRSKVDPYKDPLAKSKLEIIKNIRAQRATADTQRTEAILRAKLLIAEAEKAAKALEAAATKSHLAQASLIETRKLIDEAIRSIEFIEEGQVNSHENGRCSPFALTEVGGANSNDTDQSSLPNSVDAGDHDSDENCRYLPLTSAKLLNHVEEGTSVKVQDAGQTERRIINGTYTSSENEVQKFDFSDLPLQGILNDRNEILPMNISSLSLLNDNGKIYARFRDHNSLSSVLNGMIKQTTFANKLDHLEPNGSSGHQNIPRNDTKSKSDKREASSATTVTKKWVRGRLVEVAEVG